MNTENLTIERWDKQSPINGCEASRVLRNNPEFNHSTCFLLKQSGRVVRIECEATVRANLGITPEATAEEVMQAYMDNLLKTQQESEQAAGREKEQAAVFPQVASLMRMTINTLPLTDEQALSVRLLYPEWVEKIGKPVKAGEKYQHDGKLFRVRQDIPALLEHQPPSIHTAALYEEINETAKGTMDAPIPYNNNMELAEGKYYVQNGVVYLCTRSTGTAVYHDLSALVGLYVNVA